MREHEASRDRCFLVVAQPSGEATGPSLYPVGAAAGRQGLSHLYRPPAVQSWAVPDLPWFFMSSTIRMLTGHSTRQLESSCTRRLILHWPSMPAVHDDHRQDQKESRGLHALLWTRNYGEMSLREITGVEQTRPPLRTGQGVVGGIKPSHGRACPGASLPSPHTMSKVPALSTDPV